MNFLVRNIGDFFDSGSESKHERFIRPFSSPYKVDPVLAYNISKIIVVIIVIIIIITHQGVLE